MSSRFNHVGQCVSDLGRSKPDPEMFRAATRVAGAQSARCLFVDDTAANVAAARTEGLRAHLFGGVPALLDELRSVGIGGR